MSKRYAGRSGQVRIPYRIVIRGELGEPLVGPLEGMTVEVAGEESVLAGDLLDQAQLQGVLSSLTALGVEIVSVNPARQTMNAAARRFDHDQRGEVMAIGPVQLIVLGFRIRSFTARSSPSWSGCGRATRYE